MQKESKLGSVLIIGFLVVFLGLVFFKPVITGMSVADDVAVMDRDLEELKELQGLSDIELDLSDIDQIKKDVSMAISSGDFKEEDIVVIRDAEGAARSARIRVMDDKAVVDELSSVVEEIIFNDIDTERIADLGVEDLEEEQFVQSFAIDPTDMNFSDAVVTVTAKGTQLYKCKEWNFEARSCESDWKLFKDNLVPGETYSFTLTPDDPGFGEANITVINVQSYPVVGGNWTVQFSTIGTANLSIEAIDGTTWSDSAQSEDLEFMRVRCGSTVQPYQWTDNKVVIEDYSCNETGTETSNVLTGGKHHLKFTFGNDTEYARNDVSTSV
ncbi:MAG: hypothetical protein ACE5DM_03625, partial [Candidatus Nanoarchaeia archaeon]